MPRSYTNVAPPISLTVGAAVGDTTLTVASTTGYPTAPFLLGLERGTSNEEVVLCTASTSTVFTVTRGYDSTTAKGHLIGTAVEHTVGAIDYRQAMAASRVPHTFAMPGAVTVPSGETNYIPGMFVPVPTTVPGLTATLAAVRYKIHAGTSATFTLQRNEAAITAGTALVASTTATTTTVGQAITDGDYLNVAVTAVAGSPLNFSITLYIDYSY